MLSPKYSTAAAVDLIMLCDLFRVCFDAVCLLLPHCMLLILCGSSDRRDLGMCCEMQDLRLTVYAVCTVRWHTLHGSIDRYSTRSAC